MIKLLGRLYSRAHMWGVIWKNAAKIVVLLAPVVVPNAWLSWLETLLQLAIQPSQSQSAARIAAEGLSVLLVVPVELLEVYLPLKSAREFRAQYLSQIEDDLEQKLSQASLRLGSDIRFNIMLLRRPNVLRPLKWICNLGFGPQHGGHAGDVHMRIYPWQGLCGVAMREGIPKFLDLRAQGATSISFWFWKNPFRMSRGQLERTKHVQALLSVPIYRESGDAQNPTFRVVGVANIDGVSQNGARWLAQQHNNLGQYLASHGVVIGALA